MWVNYNSSHPKKIGVCSVQKIAAWRATGWPRDNSFVTTAGNGNGRPWPTVTDRDRPWPTATDRDRPTFSLATVSSWHSSCKLLRDPVTAQGDPGYLDKCIPLYVACFKLWRCYSAFSAFYPSYVARCNKSTYTLMLTALFRSRPVNLSVQIALGKFR
jgi:hypothetical protein